VHIKLLSYRIIWPGDCEYHQHKWIDCPSSSELAQRTSACIL